MATNFKMEHCENDFYNILFVSRNKDNRDIEGFKERREIYMTDETHLANKLELFDFFVNKGKDDELSRCYISVNKRSGEKTYKKFLHFLIDHPEFPIPLLPSKIAAISANKECAAESKWLIDFDSKDKTLLQTFLSLLQTYFEENDIIEVNETIHGYAIIVPHGFDSRWIAENEQFNDISVKRDDMLLARWKTKCN